LRSCASRLDSEKVDLNADEEHAYPGTCVVFSGFEQGEAGERQTKQRILPDK